MAYLIEFKDFNRMNDHFVKYIFMNENTKHLLIKFLNSILKMINLPKIVDVTFKDREFHAAYLYDKTGSVDVYCLGSDNRIYNIEFQNEKYAYMVNRSFHYGAKLLLNLKSGDDYDKLKKVCSINILNHRYFDNIDEKIYFHPFKFQHQVVKNYYIDNFINIYIEISKWEKEKPEIRKMDVLDIFLAFFSKNSSYEYLMEIAKENEIMAQMMDSQDNYRQNHDLLIGYKDAEDVQKDFRSVIKANVDETKREIVQVLKRKKIDIETIKEATGWSEEAIKACPV